MSTLASIWLAVVLSGSPLSRLDCAYPYPCNEDLSNPCCVQANCTGVLATETQCIADTNGSTGAASSTSLVAAAVSPGSLSRLMATCNSSYRTTNDYAYALRITSDAVAAAQSVSGTASDSRVYCPVRPSDSAQGGTFNYMCTFGVDSSASASITSCFYRADVGSRTITAIGCKQSVDGGTGWCVDFTEPIDLDSYSYFTASYITPGTSLKALRARVIRIGYSSP